MLNSLCGKTLRPPKWIKPQLTRPVEEAPPGVGWLHEIKYDGYRMHAHRRRRGCAADSEQPGLVAPLPSHDRGAWLMKVKSAYLDGELCALNSQGVPVLSRPQAAMAEHARPDFVYSRRSYVKTATTSLPSGALRGADVQVSTLPLICMV